MTDHQDDRQIDIPFGLRAHARSTDLATSHRAARALGDLTDRQRALLDLFAAGVAMTDPDIRVLYQMRGGIKQSDSGLRTRRHELVEQGHVARAGERRTATGRAFTLWQITPTGVEWHRAQQGG